MRSSALKWSGMMKIIYKYCNSCGRKIKEFQMEYICGYNVKTGKKYIKIKENYPKCPNKPWWDILDIHNEDEQLPAATSF